MSEDIDWQMVAKMRELLTPLAFAADGAARRYPMLISTQRLVSEALTCLAHGLNSPYAFVEPNAETIRRLTSDLESAIAAQAQPRV